ncbi:MAG: tRNA uridine-5-carboxymethylaminomethyl(34) synthesis enzyme MnmG [Deltaproteobacteria bacterium]|nr:MAG: tRNA uridine-5-carboxymethylaminomethyl(34) synthesis enzyme MnmG [Deltaproteobacteria bacterium]
MFDIVVIGGGHAGVEAAWISQQFGLKVAILSLPGIGLASTPCNPAVGGVGKGQVVREIDALGGLMGRLADLSAIQYRTLNESKGYAVQSTRVQVDKDAYSRNAEKIIAEETTIEVLRDKAVEIDREEGIFNITLESSIKIQSRRVIITAGTFLSGLLHTGEEKTSGGRTGCVPGPGLQALIKEIKLNPLRFKTGTPARLNKNSIDFSVMDPQESDEHSLNFHFAHEPKQRFLEQVSCYLSRTNEDTLGIIRSNKDRSPIFNGQIKGVGPRYCPSIEDKAFRYPDRNSHHVFVEPEGLETDSVYPNGISTSLPKEVQEAFIRTIPGLENAEILVHGYAVEYDVVDTTQLDRALEHTEVPGLFFAGQINGTSGYEEAAGQGLIAGLNASLGLVGRSKLHLKREESYIGVMVEDLVTQKRDEPYRLFTARNERRLFVREDNTFLRMAPYRLSLGLNTNLDQSLSLLVSEYEVVMNLLSSYRYRENQENREHFLTQGYGTFAPNITLSELLKRSFLDPVAVLTNELLRAGIVVDSRVVRTAAISNKYAGYIDRAKIDLDRVDRFENKKIDYTDLLKSSNISTECKQRISEVRPETFGQLKRIQGIRPATLATVAGNFN